MKTLIKRLLLIKRGIILDSRSVMKYGCEFSGGRKCKIINSFANISKMGEGCFIENACIYGDVELGRFVHITGPGTIIHSEINKISIGSFSSIAPNVSIIEFNHDMSKTTTSSIQSTICGKTPKDDFISKGSIVIEEDVWIGGNVAVLSGVKIGRGAVIAAGAVVNHDIEPYSVYGGVPAKKIKMRFSADEISRLEKSQWWNWNEEKIRKNQEFFQNGGECNTE